MERHRFPCACQLITDQADRAAPTRVVFDSVSEMRLLAEEPHRFRGQVLALKQFFAARKATVLPRKN